MQMLLHGEDEKFSTRLGPKVKMASVTNEEPLLVPFIVENFGGYF